MININNLTLSSVYLLIMTVFVIIMILIIIIMNLIIKYKKSNHEFKVGDMVFLTPNPLGIVTSSYSLIVGVKRVKDEEGSGMWIKIKGCDHWIDSSYFEY